MLKFISVLWRALSRCSPENQLIRTSWSTPLLLAVGTTLVSRSGAGIRVPGANLESLTVESWTHKEVKHAVKEANKVKAMSKTQQKKHDLVVSISSRAVALPLCLPICNYRNSRTGRMRSHYTQAQSMLNHSPTTLEESSTSSRSLTRTHLQTRVLRGL